ncbi:Pathogenicity locus [Marichromatium purpuratum 984]|uniref:Pathogenicity locus n=1 Tax=Marichromatium purpuratum 984 TaxID=765910 RepID=W0E4Z0_MARPU|nr:hypothetical protein [Marichromatium purpuratum]AHF04136.1 Pathogenicity locus [Marichromatium purpuratum 984]
MPFSSAERALLLGGHQIGPRVIARLEQLGVEDLDTLAEQQIEPLVGLIADMLHAPCWRASPHARTAIGNAIAIARAARERAR